MSHLKILQSWILDPERDFQISEYTVSEIDQREAFLDEIDPTKIEPQVCLRPEDEAGHITGEEKLKRIKEGTNIPPGYKSFITLWKEKGHKTLWWLYYIKGSPI